MLVILAGGPVATPLEASCGEETETEVIVVDFIGEVQRAVTILSGGGRLNEASAVSAFLVVGIIEGVDINGQSAGMLGEVSAAGDGAVAEARRVVVAHLGLVISIVDIGQEHLLDSSSSFQYRWFSMRWMFPT